MRDRLQSNASLEECDAMLKDPVRSITIVPALKIAPNGCAGSLLQSNPAIPVNRVAWKGVIAQISITMTVMLVMASCGMPIGYSAILLPQLESVNSTLPITEEIGSWIASVHSAATPFGGLLGGLLMDRFGRKHALQMSLLPLVIGWTLIATSSNHTFLIVGRFLAGLAVGLSGAPSTVLIGETSEPKLRGMLSSVPVIGYSMGILVVYILGSVFDWRTVAGLSIIIPFVSFVIFIFLPDSPTWLIRQERYEEARKALNWLRGGGKETEKEFEELVLRIRDEGKENNNGSNSISLNDVPETWYAMFVTPQVLKPFIIINIFTTIQMFSGTYIVVYYAVDIIAQMGETDIDNITTAILTAVVRFMFTIVAIVLIALIGRRPLAMISCLGTGVSAVCLGLFLSLRDPLQPSPYDLYITLVCLIVYVGANTVGLFPMAGLLIGELIPAQVRGFIGGMCFAIFNIVLFVLTKTFPMIKRSIGIAGMFYIFGISSLLGAVFIYFVLPETKGKSLEQIEDYFLGKNILWRTRKRSEPNLASA